jgi:hypothetical protein
METGRGAGDGSDSLLGTYLALLEIQNFKTTVNSILLIGNEHNQNLQ